VRRLAVLVALAGLAALPAAARASSTLVVDDDHVQCPAAGFTSLQAAVDAAQSHDTIRICPGTYAVGTPGAPRPSNGLMIDKSLTIVGAGASKVTIEPATDLGDTALTPAKLRDAAGNIITIKNTAPGSTSVQDVSVALSGVTVKDAGFAVDAGVAASNAYAQITGSAIGPFTGAGQGWGVVAVNTESVSPQGAFVRVLTLTGDSITGYGGGGVLIDGATSAAPTTASGVATTGIITGDVIQGAADATRASQIGIQVNQGARATITGDTITGNLATTATAGVGVLLTNSDNAKTTPTASTYFTSLGRNNLTGNGYGIYNASDNTVTTVSSTPVQANLPGGSWYGTGGPLMGPSTATQDGVSDAVVTGTAAASPVTVGPVPSAIVDAPPTAAWGTPAAGDSLVAGHVNDLLALAADDFGVTSVDVTANGDDLGTLVTPPYATTWTPAASLAGQSVTLTATVTDEAGQTTVATETIPVVAPRSPPGGGGGGGGGTPSPPPSGGTMPAKPAVAFPSGFGTAPLASVLSVAPAISAPAGVARVTYLLGSRTICAPSAAPWSCRYLLTGADAGGRVLSVVVTDRAGQTGQATVTIRVSKFAPRGLSVRTKRHGTGVTVSGRVLLPARVTGAQGCSGAVVTISGKHARAAREHLTASCRWSAPLAHASGVTSVRVRFRGTAAVAALSRTVRVH
jgi:hypothetical protein